MRSSTLVTTVFISTISFVIASTSDISFTCLTRSGDEATGVGKISQVQCGTGETMVSCGILGWEGIGGAWISNYGVCQALSNYNGFHVIAEARCCIFPSGSIVSTSISSSTAGQHVSATCDCNQVLTGCHVHYASGAYGKVRGSFAGPLSGSSSTSTPQTAAWIPTENQCNGASYKTGQVKASASCLTVADGFTLECKTKAVFTTRSGFGSCESGYTMMACNTFTDSHTLDAYYIKRNSHGVDQCFVEQDGYANMYANVICCKLMKSAPSSPNNSNNPLDCGCQEDCTINCDDIDPHKGCSNAVIDARHATSLHLICSSSKSAYSGGCQMATVYCPEASDSQCNIECNDYFGCYLTNIHSSYSHTIRHNQNVSVACADEEGSCLETTLYANTSSNVRVSCYGSGILGSKSHSACDKFEIHVEDLGNDFNLLCSDDYSCYRMYLYANNANAVYVHARGNMALANSYIYAKNAANLDLFCGSEQSEYGCYKLYVYNPIYTSLEPLRTTITCQGHGCYDEMYLDSAHGALDVNISINGCGECNDVASCVSNWHFYCDEMTFDTFDGDSCETDNCYCSYAATMLRNNWINSMEECDIFTFDYECPPHEDCVIDCVKQWPNDNGCYDKAINGENATSLSVICNSTQSIMYGACESAHIHCPNSNGNSQCDIECSDKDACYDTEISILDGALLNLTCSDKDSCSHTNVYGDSARGANIFIDCIDTDACDYINVTAPTAENITIRCSGNQDFEAYAACDGFTVNARNVTNKVELICNGDYSCYRIDIDAASAHRVVVESIGDYGSYGGRIYATNADAMSISCKSQYSEYGCYKMAFYIPSGVTSLHCEGHGCHYLDLYAPRGFTDLSQISMNGCGECDSIAQCVGQWMMFCGDAFQLQNRWNGANAQCLSSVCECNNAHYTTLYGHAWMNDATQCNLMVPDESCVANEACVVDCSDANTKSCADDVIVGGEASRLHVICGANGCDGTIVHCPVAASCSIHCEGDSACLNMEIYGGDTVTSAVELQCAGSNACRYIEMDISDTFATNVSCADYDACYSLSMYGERANQIAMKCDGSVGSDSFGYYDYYYYYSNQGDNSTTYHSSVCDKIAINAKHAMNVEMNCSGNDACYSSNIDVEYARKVMVSALGSFSIYGGSIMASHVSRLLLHFEGASNYGVEQLSLYVPPNDQTMIRCVGFGCHDLNVYAQNGMRDIQNISFYGCDACMKPEICIADWNLYCNGDDGAAYTTSTTYTGSQCHDNGNCDCSEFKAEIEEAFIFDIEAMEAVEGVCGDIDIDFSCDADKECVIDCPGNVCQNAVIYGAKALSLTVNCASEWACNWLQVYCPERFMSQCNILCEGFDSCYDATVYSDAHNEIYVLASEQYAFEYGTVYGYEAHTVRVNCSAHESCYSSQIYASKAHNVDIMCFESALNESSDTYYDDYYWYYSYWNYSSDSPCYDLSVYASMVTNDLQLTCGGSYACYAINVFAQHAKRVVINGDNSEFVMQDANIYASNASQLELMCIGGKRDFGCADANIYLPLNPSGTGTAIDCYGFGCDDLNFYTKHGVSDALATKTRIDVNACGVCRIEDTRSNNKQCVNKWTLYCDLFSEYDANTKCTPTQDSDYSTECGCDTWMAVAHLNQSFNIFNNRSHSVCDILSEWQRPTHKPRDHNHNHHHMIVTGHRPHAANNGTKPNGDEDGDHAHHRMMMVMIAVVVVIGIICVIGNVAYCYYKRKMTQKIANEILAHIDDQNQGGAAAHVSVDENINYNMAPSKSQRKYVKFKDDDERNQPITGSSAITTWSLPE